MNFHRVLSREQTEKKGWTKIFNEKIECYSS